MMSCRLKFILRNVSVLSVLLLAMAGCGLVEPGDSALKTNQAPDTEITSGPKQNTLNSYFVRVAWKGVDPDGIITGYQLTVDGVQVNTTKTDSTFSFSAANQDEVHTIAVAAVDNQGEVDQTPASLSFTATNAEPNTSISIEGNPAPGATFGKGGVFTIVAEDADNGPEFSYRFKIDDTGAWSDWLTNGEIEFSLTSTFGLLPEGSHRFIAQVRDAGFAVDPTPAEFPFVVSTAVKPAVSLTRQFNNQPFYEDNSVFSFPTGNTANFAWSVSFNYAGAKSAGSRYRIDGGAWTEYSTSVESLELANITPGAHTFEVQYRDVGGVESDVLKFEYEVVAATFNAGVLVVDDGNGQLAGRPPATGDANADNFYSQVLTAVGARFALWDVLTQGAPTPKKGFGNYSTVIWQSDEATSVTLPRQLQLLGDYLTVGGNLWVAGWRSVNQIAGTTPVANFDPSQPNAAATFAFVWNYLKVASTRQTPGNVFEFAGATGASGYPNINVDATKNPIPNRAGLSPIDVFTVRAGVAGAEAVYTFNAATSAPDFQGAPVGIKYSGSDFNTFTMGFPFYHLNSADAEAAARKILQDFGEL